MDRENTTISIEVNGMSYLHYGSILRYVEGQSKDYVYPTECKYGREFIQDYGEISNEGLVELVCRQLDDHLDKVLAAYLMKKLAEKLNVKLRPKPLTEKQFLKLSFAAMK